LNASARVRQAGLPNPGALCKVRFRSLSLEFMKRTAQTKDRTVIVIASCVGQPPMWHLRIPQNAAHVIASPCSCPRCVINQDHTLSFFNKEIR